MKPKFLVVDDDPDILFLVEIMIRAWGCECLTATSAEAALEVCRREQLDAAILDVMMPQTDGPSLLRRLRDEGCAPTHVAFMSALPTGQLQTIAAEFDARIVSKPFTATALRDTFEDLLQGAGERP